MGPGSSTKSFDLMAEIPPGWRFKPTDEEIVHDYLSNKVLLDPLPDFCIEEIDAEDLRAKHPKCLVKTPYSYGNELGGVSKKGKEKEREKEWYLFIYEDEYFDGKTRRIETVGNGVIGEWRFDGGEEQIRNSEGNVFGFKIFLQFYSGNPPKRTPWRMIKYRLDMEFWDNKISDQEVENWILGRIINGREYNDTF
ncbi:OLC1v1012202C2 [Oldenlandia corymbosa var. corymbosa]|nr:OLC1v1012202C2 [Oldenlandia corymbosa var. corymbosa]